MHDFDLPKSGATSPATGPWYHELSRYHWFVLIVAALGWLFDTMDQQLFTLARVPAMRELLAPGPGQSALTEDVDFYGPIATMIFLIGWATGGLGFGILGDRVGRARVMLWTILIYSLFTGLSALAWDFWSFSVFRFLTGLGVGGEFAVGVALVAEVMPPRARPFALGLLQALSAVGNISAALISLLLFKLEQSQAIGSAWRIMFVIGALPALLAILIRRRLKEPERWHALSGQELKKKLGSYGELFSHPVWRKNAIVGMLLAFSGVVGLWGIGFFSPDLNRSVFRKKFEGDARDAGEAEKDRQFINLVVRDSSALDSLDEKKRPQPNQFLSLAEGAKQRDAEAVYSAITDLRKTDKPVTSEAILEYLDQPSPKRKPQTSEARARRQEYLSVELLPQNEKFVEEHASRITARAAEINAKLGMWAGITLAVQNIGAFFGIYAFTYLTHFIGRKAAFAISFVLALLSTALVFGYLSEFSQIFWMIPMMGFCQLALFGGYAIYFPELFPTHLRSTGTSFCYNVGRFVAASGPYGLGWLATGVFAGQEEPMRYAGLTMCAVFLVGLAVLPWAPETKGKPLPE
jgi:MFS family permease